MPYFVISFLHNNYIKGLFQYCTKLKLKHSPDRAFSSHLVQQMYKFTVFHISFKWQKHHTFLAKSTKIGI